MRELKNLRELRAEFAALRFRVFALRLERRLRNYNPDQPRVPRGRPEGGQWTRIAGIGGIAGGKWDNGNWDICEAQYERDFARCPPFREVPVEVRVYLPSAIDAGWDCRYEIDWPEGTLKSHVVGIDALHALNLVQQKIGLTLLMSRYHQERSMWWIRPEEGYGFPVPKNARDLLIGHDQRFYGLDAENSEGRD